MNNETNHYPDLALAENEISFVEIASAILRNWRVVAVLPVVLALAAGVWSLTRDDRAASRGGG